VKIFLTGGAGYVGSRLAAHLLGAGHDLTVFDALVYGGQALLPFIGKRLFRLVKGDVRDRDALGDAMRSHDAVVHLAAFVGEPACSLDPALTVAVNRDGALAALELAESLGVGRFVFFSTCSNYGVSDPQSLADEDAALNPLSLYASTKVDVERAALERRGTCATTVLRLGTICGLSARMRFDLLVSEMARAAALHLPIEVYKPEAWRPYLHIADAGRIVETVLTADRTAVGGRVFNVVGDNYQKIGLVALVRENFPDADIRVTDGKPDNRDYRVSAARVERELGFKPEHTVREAFLETAYAVRDGVFVDPMWEGHSAIPLGAKPVRMAV
jgi:nucleoside-diphosphate-sugar epimerase